MVNEAATTQNHRSLALKKSLHTLPKKQICLTTQISHMHQFKFHGQHVKSCQFRNRPNLPLLQHTQQCKTTHMHYAQNSDTMDNTISPRQHLGVTVASHVRACMHAHTRTQKCHYITNEAKRSKEQEKPHTLKNPTSERRGNSKSRPPNMISLLRQCHESQMSHYSEQQPLAEG